MGKKREKLYSVNETAKILGYSAYSVYRWLRDGTLNGYHLSGHKWRISEEHIDDFLNNKKETKEDTK